MVLNVTVAIYALPSGFDKAVWTQSSRINSGLPYLIGNPPSK